MLGAQVDGPQQATFNDLHLDFYPRVVWSPFFAMTIDDLKVYSIGQWLRLGCAGQSQM